LDVLEGEEGLFYFDCSQKPIDNQFLLQLQKNAECDYHAAYGLLYQPGLIRYRPKNNLELSGF
jgi:hypothetical protein